MIRPGAVGDTIVSLPAVEFLCRQASEWAEVWVSPACVPLVQFANRVRSIGSTGLDLLELGLDTPAWSALAEFDAVVSWYGSARPEFWAAVRDFPFTFYSALPPAGCGVSAVDWYLSQVGGALGGVPSLRFDGVEAREFVACQPFSGGARKNWGVDRFLEVASGLGVPVEFCVGPEEE
ncbi:MAG: hypothetical protein SGI92_25455, partial [Bryobacteraceae bacterium]|nr:hypothetical protein [Bryobacteraceae bacterium]